MYIYNVYNYNYNVYNNRVQFQIRFKFGQYNKVAVMFRYDTNEILICFI